MMMMEIQTNSSDNVKLKKNICLEQVVAILCLNKWVNENILFALKLAFLLVLFFTHNVLGSYLRFVFHIASSILGIAEPRHFFVSFFFSKCWNTYFDIVYRSAIWLENNNNSIQIRNYIKINNLIWGYFQW